MDWLPEAAGRPEVFSPKGLASGLSIYLMTQKLGSSAAAHCDMSLETGMKLEVKPGRQTFDLAPFVLERERQSPKLVVLCAVNPAVRQDKPNLQAGFPLRSYAIIDDLTAPRHLGEKLNLVP